VVRASQSPFAGLGLCARSTFDGDEDVAATICSNIKLKHYIIPKTTTDFVRHMTHSVNSVDKNHNKMIIGCFRGDKLWR